MATLQRSAFLEAIQKHDPQSTAVVHSLSGRSFTYGSLLRDVSAAKDRLLSATGKNESSIVGERIAFLVENGYDYVVTLLSCLASNAIAVPLAPSFPATELRYILNHSEALALLSSKKFSNIAQEVLKEGLDTKPHSVTVEKTTEGAAHDEQVTMTGDSHLAEGGMMLYTSGTTARPKGVLLPTAVLSAQAHSLIEAWDYSSRDHLLHVLPLHHIHGTVNALLTPLIAGSAIEFMYPFNVDSVWKRFAAPFMDEAETNWHQEDKALQTSGHMKKPITFFTVVPTVWARMLQTHAALPMPLLKASKEAIKRENLRLNISGSAALPTPTKAAWSELSSGNTLLERFGMTEVGMALSCGLADQDRIDGSVGWPLPSVEARLVDPDTNEEIKAGEETTSDGKERSGEVQLRGPTIFRGYWRNPEATKKEFTEDGWFKTGDIAARRSVPGSGEGKSGEWAKGPAYFIHGRKSADIIKTGGEKVSALEIERELLSLPEVKECAVVGLPSEAWGQKAAAVVVLTSAGETAGKGGTQWGAMDMRRALKEKLVAYKIPQDLQVVESIPRNAMGKINKKQLVEAVFGDKEKIRRRSITTAEEKARLKKEEGK
ncbi:acetyl-CoA synthetase-like protein [Hortaea werneckii]|nr:acetyl-CoA synthetase-like protein [Hortaea werneckii]